MFFKVCGIKSLAELNQLLGCDVDYVGLNFIPSASRLVDVSSATQIAATCHAAGIKTVALFKDEKIAEVKDVLNVVPIDYVQLNGEEDQAFIDELGLPVMKTIAVSSNMTSDDIADKILAVHAHYYILDRSAQGQGPMVDTVLFNSVASKIPSKLVLAGGLTPDNLAAILQQVHPAGIDISSGVRTGDMASAEKVRRCTEIIEAAASR